MVKKRIMMIILSGLLVLPWSPVSAGDYTSLAKQANKDIRSAQRNMFSGKTDQAVELLFKVREAVAEIKTLQRLKSSFMNGKGSGMP